jgi:hypothetical protein
LWHSIFLEWDRCNILDGSGDVPTYLPKLIYKSTFGCLANIKEIQLEKLARGLLAKMITLEKHPTKGGSPSLLAIPTQPCAVVSIFKSYIRVI